MSSRTTSIVTIAGVTAVTGILAYVIYFDYKRRNDVEFRKQLRKDKKRVDKTVAQVRQEEAAAAASSEITQETIRAAYEQIIKEPEPADVDAKEAYFMKYVGMGEILASEGPSKHLQAAGAFYRALRMYPSPAELIAIYQKTVPEPVFILIMQLTNMDVKARAEGYYNYFPPKAMNVSIEHRNTADAEGNPIMRKALVANKAFATGDLIYKELPVVATLDFDLHGEGTYCSQCFRTIQKGMAIRNVDARTYMGAVYCSKACQLKANSNYEKLLFTAESPLPPILAQGTPAQTPEDKVRRKNAQEAYVAYLQRRKAAAPLLVAEFIGRQVEVEVAKMVPGLASSIADLPVMDGGDYSLNDHMERLRYLEVVPPSEEPQLLADVLRTALPGLEQFVTDERHCTLLGKMAYNSYGVCFGGGRDDKPTPTARPEDVEKSRTPYGTQKQIGSGFYLVSSYIAHSCAPSARPSFSAGTNEMHLIADKPIKKGDEITVAFVDVVQHQGESDKDCRTRRRKELARGWRFACMCDRCVAGMLVGGGAGVGSDDGKIQKDESKVEIAMARFES